MTIRIGQGFDIHAFCTGDHIMLGGVRIEHTRGLEAHSDGDVVLHALSDALLGALALGDIGRHFPDNDPDYAGADSRSLLREVYGLVRECGYRLVNADITVMAQAPRIAPHIDSMRDNIAADLSAEREAVSVKATTTERLGAVGREEGIAASAVVLINRLQ